MTGRGPGRPAGTTAQDSRRRILQAARSGFAHSGFSATTMREIAARCEMRAGNIRHHFGSKADLFAAVYDDCIATVGTALEDVLHSPAGTRPGECVRALASVLASEPDLLTFMAVAPIERTRHPELRSALRPATTAVESVFRAAVPQLTAREELASDIDAQSVADALLAMTYGVLVYTTLIDPAADQALTLEAFARILDGPVRDRC